MRWLTLASSCSCCSPAPRPVRPPSPAGRPALRVDRLPRHRRSRRGSRRRCRDHQDAGAVLRLAEGHGLDGDLARRHRRGGARHAAAARQGDPDHLRRRLSQPLHPRLSAAQGLSLPGRGGPGRHLDGGRGRWHGALRRRQVGAAQQLRLLGRGARDAGVGAGRVRLAQLRPAPRRAGQPAGQHDARRRSPGATIRRRDATRRRAVPRPHPRRPAALAPADRRQSWPAAARDRLAIRPLHGGLQLAKSPRRSASPSRSRSSRSRPTRPTCSRSIATSRRKTPPWATSRATCASIRAIRPRAASSA